MPDLIARGEDPKNQWRQTLPQGSVTLGRTKKSVWQVPWDNLISGCHATLVWQDGKLHVRREPDSQNKIFFSGDAVEEFSLGIGEHFVIGKTEFILEESEPTPDAELTCSAQELHQVRYVDPNERIEALAALPGLIRFSPSDEELESRVVDVLLRGMPRAVAAAVVRLDPTSTASQPEVEVRCVKDRGGRKSGFRPSRRLVFHAVDSRRQSVLHHWLPRQGPSGYTQVLGSDWAICAPLFDSASVGWALYVMGRLEELPGEAVAAEDLLKSDLKFAELVSEIFGELRQVRDLQRRHALLERFFSRPVRTALAEQDMEAVLRPRQAEVTVLFCDLRGSCRLAEEEELSALCDSMREALDIMASNIIDLDGVIGDFQGDAAMGFWGWPLDCPDQIQRAARAALNIRRRFVRLFQQRGSPLANLTCGLGLANGPAIVGRLGTFDQFKVDVFGPVVNLASRLESMTKILQVPILVDERVADGLAREATAWAHCRRLARLRPYGMHRELLVSELLPPTGEPGAMSDRDRRDYEAGLDAFLAGRWQDASRLLDRLPQDGGARFLKAFMDRHEQRSPVGWDGIIPLEGK